MATRRSVTPAAIRAHNRRLLGWFKWLWPADRAALMRAHRAKPLGGKCGLPGCQVCGKMKLVLGKQNGAQPQKE